MSAANFQIGDRVVLIPFQHKNKVATVKYCGPIGKKFGTWVALELDEPTGDCNGLENNGEKVFECEENYGLILRNTQVRPYDPNAPVAIRQQIGQPPTAPSKLMVGDEVLAQFDEKKISTGLSGSPLLTPQASFIVQSLQESQAALLEKVNKALPLATTTEANDEGAGDGKSKIKGWKERLKKIEERKAEEKTKKDTNAGMDLDGDGDEQLSKQFGLTSGLRKDQNGKLIVAHEEVKQRPNLGEEILKRMQEKEQAQADAKSPLLNNAGSPGKPGHSRMISNADKIKEKTAKLEEERKLRQGLTSIAKTTTAGSRNAGLAGQKSLNSTLTKDATVDKKVSGATTARTGLNSTLRTAQKDGSTPGDKPPGGLSRAGSSSRLGLQANGTAERTAMNRVGSSSRLGLAAPGTRTGSSTRQPTGAIRGVGRGDEKTPVKDLNSTLTRGLASRAGGKTPLPTRPGASDTPVKGLRRTVLPKDASKMTPLDYKKMEAQIIDKSAEIQSLQEEVQNLSLQISQLGELHKTELEILAHQKQDDLKALTDRHADEKIQFQTELESITERMINASPDGTGQNQEIMEMATQQLSQIREDQQNRLKSEQENVTKIQQELQELKQLMGEKNHQISKLQDQVQILTGQIKEQELLYQNEIQSLNERLEEQSATKDADDFKKTQVEIQEAQTALQASIEASLEARIAEIQKQTEKEKALVSKDVQQRDAQIKDLTKRLSDQATAYQDLELRQLEEQELFQLELEQLKDEKEEVLRRLMENAKVDEEDQLKDVSIEEIKIQNKKLRIAITSLTFGFEEERKKLEAALQDETSKDREIAELQGRIKEMDFLLEEVELKEQERAEMQDKLEEIVEYENMVEEMVQEIAKKEEENEDLRAQLTEIELEKNLMEDLTAQMEVYNKELTTEISEKDTKITEFKTEIEQLEIIVVEQEELADKYKERLSELQKQIRVLIDQLQEYTQDGSKDQVSMLVEKQQCLIRQLRESESKQLEVQKNFIELWQGRTYTDLVVQILPIGLQKEAQLQAYSKVQQLNSLRHKATLFFREVCEKQLEQAPQLFEEFEHLNLYVQLLVKLGLMMAQIVSQCSTIQFQIANSTPEQYRDICNILAWDQLPHLLGIVDMLLDQLNSQSLSYSYETEDIFVELKSLEILMTKTEKIFIALSPEEQVAQQKDGVAPEKMIQSIPCQRRQNLANHCSKLKLRNQSVTMALGVSLVSYYSSNQEDWRSVQQKCKLIYLRLLDTIMKIDHIANDDDGGDFIDVKQLNTELRLAQKFENIQTLWAGTESELDLARQNSWLSVLEAIERDITTLNNDFKFKRLIKIVDQKYGSGKIDFNDLYTLDFQAAGPWRQIAKSIQAELQDMTTLKQKNTQLQEKQKEQVIQVLTLKREQERQQLISTQLDSKLSQALAKAEQVPALEIEKKDLLQTIVLAKKQTDATKEELDKSQKTVGDLKQKLDDARKAAAAAPAPSEQQQVQQQQPTGGRPNIRARYMANKHSSRQSRTNNYYDTLRNTGGFSKQDPNAGHNRTFSTVNNDKIMQQMNQQEDVYMQIISELQYDRLRLKAKDMTRRITALNQDGSSFSSLLKQFGRQEIKLNSEEQTVVQAAIKEVAGLKLAYKRQMARARVINLQKSTSSQKEETIERLNQQVSRAKESVNDTISLLLSKNTKLVMTPQVRHVVEPDKSTDFGQQSTENTNPISTSEVKIGEIKLRGKIQLPARKVILDSSTLSDLRRNLAVFTC